MPFRYLLLLLAVAFMSACAQHTGASAQATIGDDATARPNDAARDTLPVAEYVVAALTDSKGNLWFGTNGQGVARWDGQQLRYFSTTDGLIDAVVTGIAEDPTGQLWFGTQAGVSRCDPAAQSGTEGMRFTGYGPAEGLSGSGCKVLVDRNGGVWAGTSAGVFRFVTDRFVPFELPAARFDTLTWKMNPGKVWDLFEDSKGHLWFGLDGHGALEYNGTTFTRYTKADGLCSNNVASIQEDAQGRMWFGCITSDHPQYIAEGGACMYDGASFTRFPALRGLTANDIYNIYADRSGNIWIGAVRVGAYRHDGKTFILFDRTDRPDLTRYFAVQAFTEDNNGTLWFGFSGGLFRFTDSGFVHVPRCGPWK